MRLKKTLWRKILRVLARYEEENSIINSRYKVSRILFYLNEGIDDDEFVQELYAMARDGRYISHTGNVGWNDGDTEVPGALPELVEVALTELGKKIANGTAQMD